MDKQKKIEEIAKEVYDNSNYSEVMSKEIARYIVKNGYRKIPEGAVVLTREELDKKYISISMYELAKAFHNEKCAEFEKICYDYNKLKTEQEQVRNETAKKFAERLKTECFDGGIDEKWVAVSFSRLDEICKEFTIEK